MVISLFLQQYKVFRDSSYIPVSFGQNFTAFIGENGVGKSTILEALDKLFSEKEAKEWNINRQARIESKLAGPEAPYIVPVFLLDKKRFFQGREQQKFYRTAEALSTFFWSTDELPHEGAVQKFYRHREIMRQKFSPDEYFLFPMGKRHDIIRHTYFGEFHELPSLRRLFIPDYPDSGDAFGAKSAVTASEERIQKAMQGFFDALLEHFSFLYIPVETDVALFTKLETTAMQELMASDIRGAIINAIGPEVLGEINEKLDLYLERIHMTLGNYSYKSTWKDSLKMSDLVNKIIEAYFSVRILHKKSQGLDLPVDSLSSGEKRRAIIDVIYSFLKQGGQRSKELIIAVDEPEASLNVTSRFDQFEKLRQLAAAGHQVMATTHWYGFLPVISDAVAHYLAAGGDRVSLTTFDLYSYREKIKHDRERNKGKLPYDISLKSHNDLVQAIFASLRGERPYNWLICEGTTEKIYFEYYLAEEIRTRNLRILSMGGAEEVSKIYEYLQIPMKERDPDMRGKVFCLIDTDERAKNISLNKAVKNLDFRRLLNDPDKGTLLVDADSSQHTPPTEIEDALEPAVFFAALEQFGDASLQQLLAENPLNPSAKNSYEALDLRPSDYTELKDFFDRDNNKYDFAVRYVEKCRTNPGKAPAWIEELRKFYAE